MKYWRGYLAALIFAAIAWALIAFAQANSILLDMIYPYISRMVMDTLAGWSADIGFCLWQAALLLLIGLGLASIVLMVVLRWNPVQWFGWVMAVVSLFYLLNTGIYGLNTYAGPLSDDLRMDITEYEISELEEAAVFYRDKANALAEELPRDSDGNPKVGSFDLLAKTAGEGFHTLAYNGTASVFAGSTVPVKELSWSGLYGGTTGVTVALTGEAAVNPNVPAAGLPFAMCHELAHRMCIASDPDANFAAFLTGSNHSEEAFQYSAYMMAYRFCRNGLASIETGDGAAALARVEEGVSPALQQDLERYDAFAGATASGDLAVCDLLVNYHIQEYVLPLQVDEDAEKFDPRDPEDVDLTGIVNAG